MGKSSKTNFEHYASSPEILAEFLDHITWCCADNDEEFCRGCELFGNCDYKADILRWLKSEAE